MDPCDVLMKSRYIQFFFFFSSRRRHTRLQGDWSSDVCSSDLAVGGLIGLLGGPLGVVVGAATGSLLGTVRDYWVAGVALDFVEEASNFLQPGKTAVVAEVEEEWATPIDAAMRALGGVVIRRARIDALQAQFDADIVAVKTEIAQLEAEGKHASRTAQQHLVTSLAAAHADLAKTKQSATHKLSVFTQETDARVRAIEVQVGKARGDARSRIEAKIGRASCRERV